VINFIGQVQVEKFADDEQEIKTEGFDQAIVPRLPDDDQNEMITDILQVERGLFL
jgi:hypothetical protein